MNTVEKIESEILKYFKENVHEDLFNQLYSKEFNSELVKVPYVYFGDCISSSWTEQIIDMAIWSVKGQVFVRIEYPLREENGDIIYKSIDL